MAAKLAVLGTLVLALLGSVSCQQAGYGGSPTPTLPPPPAYPPTSPTQSPAPGYPPPTSPTPSPPTPPPPAAYPPTTSPTPSPPTSYPPPTSPAPSPPTYSSPTPPPPAANPPATSPTPSPPTSYPPPPTPSPPPPPPAAGSGLRVGYYNDKCPDAETIVRDAVRAAAAGIKAGLVRLFFHDCFVQGCDASVLLKPDNDTNPQPEMLGIPNLSLRGFEVIDAAKKALEAKCPGVVSCADIVAFAGRDASLFLSGGAINFTMPAGRYDGKVSLASETLRNLPPPFADVLRLKAMFAAKGLDIYDMVALSGAHSIGRSHCSSFSSRLPPSNTSDMDPAFAGQLKASCMSPAGTDNTVAQDYKTPDQLDNQYYGNVISHKVLFASDAALLKSNETAGLVYAAAMAQKAWQYKFGQAMVKMGGVEVKTAANGEIRQMCGYVNKPYSG